MGGLSVTRLIKAATAIGVAIPVFALLALGCSGSGDDAFPPISTVDAPSSSSESVTTSDTTTPTSATSSSTSETTATGSITGGSVPDPSEGEAFDEYIAGRVEAFYAVRDRAFAEPSANPEIDYPELAELSAEPQLSVMYGAITDLHAANQAHRESADPEVGTATDEEHRTSRGAIDRRRLGNRFRLRGSRRQRVRRSHAGEIEVAGALTILEVVTLSSTSMAMEARLDRGQPEDRRSGGMLSGKRVATFRTDLPGAIAASDRFRALAGRAQAQGRVGRPTPKTMWWWFGLVLRGGGLRRGRPRG